MPVDLQFAEELQPEPYVDADSLDRALAAIQAACRDQRLRRAICVRICAAEESQQLNASFRGKDKPTNVLSFPAEVDIPEAQPPLGDLAICWPVVMQEAHAQGKSPEHHLIHLFVHGVLHLLGFDHESDAQAQVMEDLEIRILASLHIADPYAT